MLSPEENELVSRVGPGTPMGEVLRRYWMPALLAEELPEPDGAPLRVGLLGENLVAFRDTAGRVGIFDEMCPHRGASLWLGRNEEGGLRCVYHGWKYDVTGQCVDMMNEPAEFDFKEKVRVRAYPTEEIGGVIWTYMGPPETIAPPPKFAWTQVPESHRNVSRVHQECNWLQALEGGVDSSHVQALHRTFSATVSKTGPIASRGGPPNLEVDETDYGYRYFGVYPRGEQNFIRSYHYIMPFTQIRPGASTQTVPGEPTTRIYGHMWVPTDDDNCVVWNWHYSTVKEPITQEERDTVEQFLGNGPDSVDPHSYRGFATARNGWMVDRQMQRDVNFTGIKGVNTQDRATQESMGAIVDRSKEHLGHADRAIIVTRKLLLDAIQTVADGGSPPGASDNYYNARAIQDILPADVDWREALLPNMYSMAMLGS
jgi:phenylpropionate dioxygenase-like ring-hydroxylating dioxygenase large terminal subunit